MRLTRSEQGEIDRPICSASSVIEMRPFSLKDVEDLAVGSVEFEHFTVARGL